MTFKTRSFRGVHLALDSFQLDIGSSGGVHPGIYPLYTGGYIYSRWTSPPLAAPYPQGMNTLRLSAGGNGRIRTLWACAQDVLRRGAQAVGRGAVPGTHNEFLPTDGLVYISTRWLVIVSSAVLDFLAVPALSPAPVRKTVTGVYGG